MRTSTAGRVVLTTSLVALCLCFSGLSFSGLGFLGVGSPSLAHAANGDIDFELGLCGNTAQSAGADIAFSTGTGPGGEDQIWVIDQGSGQVCRYNLSAFPPDIQFASSVNHPFGPAAAPFFTPLCRGVAFRGTTQTAFVLNATTLEIVEIDTSGNQIGLPVALSPPLLDASVSGLAYDTVTGNLWYRDTVNDIAVECDPATGATVTSLPLPGEAIMYGSGLSFSEIGGVRYLEFTRGNVLDFRPSQVVRIDAATGDIGCAEVDLSAIPDPVLGIARPASGSVIYASTETSVYKLDATLPTVFPPRDLQCLSNVDGTVSLSWRNCGPGAAGLYTTVRIIRNGVVLQILSGGALSYTDPDATSAGTNLVYQVQGIAGATTASSSCAVTNGSGGLVNYVPFDGNRPYDLALDGNSGELYVTDNFSDRIYVYDTDLNLVRILATGLQNLQGVAFNSSLDMLLVSRTGSTLLTFVDPLTGLAGTALPAPVGSDVAAITYDTIDDDYLYVNAAANPVQVVRIDANPATPGAVLGSFSPPQTSGLLLGRGICHLAASDSFLAPVQESTSGGNLTSISELFENGFPTGVAFPLDAIGGSIELPNSVRGIEDLANVVYLAGSATNTVYRMLIASGGQAFVRGEANGDGTLDIADVLFIADYLFAAGDAPTCPDAADVNDSGDLDISDALYLIIYLFTSGPQPPSPFPAPGPDPTFLDPLGC